MYNVKIYPEESKKTGRTSLILITTDGHGNRTKRSLGLRHKTKPVTLIDKQDKKDKQLMALQIAQEEEKQINSYAFYVPEQMKLSNDFIFFAESFISQLTISKNSILKFKLVLKRLQECYGKTKLPAYEINELSLKRFAKFLEAHYNGESAMNLFSKLKQIIKAATDENYWRKNPALNISIKRSTYLIKAVLTHAEQNKLYNTPLANDEVRRAFLFSSTCSGLRYCDIKTLRWRNVMDDHISVLQSKTKMVVTIPLNQDAETILGQRGNPDELVFNLPLYHTTLRWLKKWAKDAGISKHITYHVGRVSFCTGLIANNVNLSVASKLMGHHSCIVTERYVKVSEALKENAVRQLPSITNQI